MLRYGDEEGQKLARSVINIFSANCHKEFFTVFLSIFDNERAVLQEGIMSFQEEMVKNYAMQEKQTVCKSFLDFCQKKEESFWMVDFWLGFDSVKNFSLQNEESLQLVLNMFFEFYCTFIQDIIRSLEFSHEGTSPRISRSSPLI
jgi:replicative superfamily II helicase